MAELIDCTTRSSESLAKRILLAHAGSKGYGVTSITANATISQLTSPLQILTPDADRDVAFEADVEVDGSVFLIFNNAASASGYDLTIKNAAASTLATVNPQNGALLLHNGTAWTAFGLAGTTGTLSLASLLIDAISEKTSGNGVSVDGLRIKDAAIAPVAGGTAVIDLSACATGEGDVVLADNLAEALTVREGSNTYLNFVTTNGSEKVQVGKTLQADTQLVTDTIAEKTSGSGVTVDGCLVKDGRAAALATEAMTTSAEQTGTGAPQTVAHAIGATPSMFWVSWTEIPAGGCSSTSVSVDATNVTLTVTSGAKFRIHALK